MTFPNYIRYNKDKFQRLGILKILVATLDPQRRSQASEAILRKLSGLLFKTMEDKKLGLISIAEYLIKDNNSPSWNFRMTLATIADVIEWGKLYGLLGSGNQITERGLLLRHLMGTEAIESINNRLFDPNPFRLKLEERLFFLYRHFEIDTSLLFLIKRLSKYASEDGVKGIEANKLACKAMYDVFELTKTTNHIKDLLAVRGLKDLIGTMVSELDLYREIPITPSIKQKLLSKAKPSQRDKKRTKASDAEGITRFEFLTDLNLLEKRMGPRSYNNIEKIKKTWHYWVTPTLIKFTKRLPPEINNEFLWNYFAYTSASIVTEFPEQLTYNLDARKIGVRVFEAYEKVGRLFGHTPFESVAIITMIQSLCKKEVVEINDIYKLFVMIKSKNLFSDSVHFAAGNEVDKMFINLKPQFVKDINLLNIS